MTDATPISVDTDMLVAAGVLVVIYALIFSEVMHRTNAAIIGAVVMVAIGMGLGFYSQEAAIEAIDANTILLLLGMMIVVAILRPTGGFEYVAIRITKLSRGNPKLLLIYLTFAVSVISMFLDNVTTIIIMAPVTVLITRIMDLNPMPYLVAEAMLSNIGGTATLVGDPPNIIIGSAAGIGFNEFIVHVGPPIAVVWVFTTGLLLYLFRGHLVNGKSARPVIDLDEDLAIKDMPALKRSLSGLGLIVLLFFLHQQLQLHAAFVAFIGLSVILSLLRPDPEELFREIHWSLLVFFASLFVIVGGVEESGLLALVGNEFAVLAEDPQRLLATALLLMWTAAFLSAIVDNIPFTVTMIPIILGLEQQGVNVMPLWWALAIGVGLGGNGTHVGATANIVVVTELDDCGMPEARIMPGQWLRIGLPTMIFSLTIASLLYGLFFELYL